MKCFLCICVIVVSMFVWTELPYGIILRLNHIRLHKLHPEWDKAYSLVVHPFKKKILIYDPDYFGVEEHKILHEMCHLEQIERDGSFIFCIKYIYYTVRYGYSRNPYELEAMETERILESNSGFVP